MAVRLCESKKSKDKWWCVAHLENTYRQIHLSVLGTATTGSACIHALIGIHGRPTLYTKKVRGWWWVQCIDESETEASCGTTFPSVVKYMVTQPTPRGDTGRSLKSRARRCSFTSPHLNKCPSLLPNISWTKLKKRRTAMKALPVTLALLALFLVASYQDRSTQLFQF